MEISLKKYEEYRIEVGETQKYKIMVTEGMAEIKGQELLNDKWYILKNIKTFIFTYTGVKLRIDGVCNLAYISTNTNILQTYKVFYDLINKDTDKVFLIIGMGRTTFCTTLINYHIRVHKKVLFTEIDLKKGNIFPGSLSSVYIDALIDYTDHIKLQNTLSYFYGNTEIKNEDLYYKQLENLQQAIINKGKDDIHLILAPEGTNKYYERVWEIFKIDRLICIGDERRYHTLNFNKKQFVKGSGYIYENTITSSMSRYFNGVQQEYTPYSFTVRRKWNVVRIGEECLAPESALPLGSSRKLDILEVSSVPLSNNCILGISEGRNVEEILNKPVLGYCVVINEETFKILCVQPKLPKYEYFIQGDIKYLDL